MCHFKQNSSLIKNHKETVSTSSQDIVFIFTTFQLSLIVLYVSILKQLKCLISLSLFKRESIRSTMNLLYYSLQSQFLGKNKMSFNCYRLYTCKNLWIATSKLELWSLWSKMNIRASDYVLHYIDNNDSDTLYNTGLCVCVFSDFIYIQQHFAGNLRFNTYWSIRIKRVNAREKWQTDLLSNFNICWLLRLVITSWYCLVYILVNRPVLVALVWHFVDVLLKQLFIWTNWYEV